MARSTSAGGTVKRQFRSVLAERTPAGAGRSRAIRTQPEQVRDRHHCLPGGTDVVSAAAWGCPQSRNSERAATVHKPNPDRRPADPCQRPWCVHLHHGPIANHLTAGASCLRRAARTARGRPLGVRCRDGNEAACSSRRLLSPPARRCRSFPNSRPTRPLPRAWSPRRPHRCALTPSPGLKLNRSERSGSVTSEKGRR